MSGSSLDGLDLVFAEIEESRGEWTYNIICAACKEYTQEWQQDLRDANTFSAKQYMLLHSAYGHLLGQMVNTFITDNNLHHQVQLIVSHGHTVFHNPAQQMTAQLGDGAAIAAVTGINVISDLRAMDVALNGQGAPIVPMGEKLLFKDYDFYLNLGGIANISYKTDKIIAFDVCAANKILNMLAEKKGKKYDENGITAGGGTVNTALLSALNKLPYYTEPFPKSLDNGFGIETVFPLVESFLLTTEDALRTYVEHIALQTGYAVNLVVKNFTNKKMLITGGGALNSFLVKRLETVLAGYNVEIQVPDEQTVQYKEALIMALLGVLRWREENTVISSVTGAKRDSIGGAVWIGQEA